MQRESTLGRALWVIVVVALAGYVVADFVRSPLLSGRGSAAVQPAQLTLWIPAGEAEGETGAIVLGAAAALELGRHTTAVKTLAGGSSQAVAEFLAEPPRDGAAEAIVVTSSTLADLARDRRDRLVPGASEEAALARELLQRSAPLGLFASEPLAIAVAADSPIERSSELVAAMREAPWERIFAIGDDTWSRVQLAALVERAGVDGNVRFSTFQAGAETGQAILNSAASTAVAPSGALREDVTAGHLRELEWPLAGPPPRSWVALVAAPGTPALQVADMRRWIGELSRDRGWLAQLAGNGRTPGNVGGADLAAHLRQASAQADRLELLARRIERG